MIDPRIPRLAAERNRLREGLLQDFPELAEDEVALNDTLDGITDAGDYIAFWCRQAREDEARAKALQSLIDDMQVRKQRLLNRAEKRREVAMSLMDAIGETKITRADMTITVNAGRQKVVITDENEIPDRYCRIKREPDKTAIRDALEAGNPVLGAELSNRTSQLTIRSK